MPLFVCLFGVFSQLFSLSLSPSHPISPLPSSINLKVCVEQLAPQVVDNNGITGYRRGMAQIEVYNATTLAVRQLDIFGQIYDEAVIVADRHGGPF